MKNTQTSAKPLFIILVNISNNDTHDKSLPEFSSRKSFSNEEMIYFFFYQSTGMFFLLTLADGKFKMKFNAHMKKPAFSSFLVDFRRVFFPCLYEFSHSILF